MSTSVGYDREGTTPPWDLGTPSLFSAVAWTFVACFACLFVFAAIIWVQHRKLLRHFNKHHHRTTGTRHREEFTSEMSALPLEEQVHLAFSDLDCWAPTGRHILRGVCGHVKPGRLVAIMGPSGCGKTTLLDIIAGRRGREYPVEGNVYVNWRSTATPEGQSLMKRVLGYMLQLACCYCENLSARINVAYAALQRLDLPVDQCLEVAEQLIDVVGLRPVADVPVGKATGGGLSGGQKRKLALAIEMVSKPPLLLLDEPTSGLDTCSALDMIAVLNRYAATGRSVVVTLHQPRVEIFAAFNTLWLMHRGRFAFAGPPLDGARFLTRFAARLKMPDNAATGANPADTVLDLLHVEGECDHEEGAVPVEFGRTMSRTTVEYSARHAPQDLPEESESPRSSSTQAENSLEDLTPYQRKVRWTSGQERALDELREELSAGPSLARFNKRGSRASRASSSATSCRQEDLSGRSEDSPSTGRARSPSKAWGQGCAEPNCSYVRGSIGDFAVAFFESTGVNSRCRERIAKRVAAKQSSTSAWPIRQSQAGVSGWAARAKAGCRAVVREVPPAARLLWKRVLVGESRQLLNTAWGPYFAHVRPARVELAISWPRARSLPTRR